MERKLIRRSTYEINPTAVRRSKIQARQAIINAYSNPIIRWYCRFRFHIINVDFLDTLEQHLSPTARVLDIGCGFGLFALYYAMTQPGRTVTGFDLSQSRISAAQAVAEKLKLTNVTFMCEDAARYQFSDTFDAVVTLDLLHHVSPDVAEHLVAQSFAALRPGGSLLVKDVNTSPLHKLLFTYALDKLMMPGSPVHYRSALAWKLLFSLNGFSEVYAYPLNDYLPYPHVLIVAKKQGE